MTESNTRLAAALQGFVRHRAAVRAGLESEIEGLRAELNTLSGQQPEALEERLRDLRRQREAQQERRDRCEADLAAHRDEVRAMDRSLDQAYTALVRESEAHAGTLPTREGRALARWAGWLWPKLDHYDLPIEPPRDGSPWDPRVLEEALILADEAVPRIEALTAELSTGEQCMNETRERVAAVTARIDQLRGDNAHRIDSARETYGQALADLPDPDEAKGAVALRQMRSLLSQLENILAVYASSAELDGQMASRVASSAQR